MAYSDSKKIIFLQLSLLIVFLFHQVSVGIIITGEDCPRFFCSKLLLKHILVRSTNLSKRCIIRRLMSHGYIKIQRHISFPVVNIVYNCILFPKLFRENQNIIGRQHFRRIGESQFQALPIDRFGCFGCTESVDHAQTLNGIS